MLLTETQAGAQGENMSVRVTFLASAVMLALTGAAHAACGPAISEFESIIDSDLKTGNVAKRVHARMASELVSVKATCAAGRDAEAMRGLAAVKSRHGYR